MNGAITNDQKVAKYFTEIVKSQPRHEIVLLDHVNYPTLHALQNEFGHQLIFELMIAMVMDLMTSLNIPSPGESQVYEIAGELLRDYPTYKPEDFKIFFTNCKKGKYGQFFNRIDISVIYTMIKIYDDERNIAWEEQLEKIKNQQIHEKRTMPSQPEEVRKIQESLYAKPLKEAAEQRAKEKIISENIEQWKIEGAEDWVEKMKVYLEKSPEHDENYYAYNFPKHLHIKWYINKKINNL